MKARGLAAVAAALWLMLGGALAEDVELQRERIAFALPHGWTSRAWDSDSRAALPSGVFAAQSADERQYLTVCAEPIKRGGESTAALARRYRASGRVDVSEAQSPDGTAFVLASERCGELYVTVAHAKANGYALLWIWTSDADKTAQTAVEMVETFHSTKEDMV